jgi:hypothetical protein
VFELTNDSTVTLVPPVGSARGVWTSALPAGATAFAVRESGDVPADGLAAVGGAATLLVPVAPGFKQVAFSYQLPPGAPPLRVRLERPTDVLEVLLEESGAAASGAGLAPVAPVALEGKTFRRYLARGAAAGATVDVVTAAGGGRAGSRLAVPALLVVVGGGMAVALVLAGRTRARASAASWAPRAAPTPALAVPEGRATRRTTPGWPRSRLSTTRSRDRTTIRRRRARPTRSGGGVSRRSWRARLPGPRPSSRLADTTVHARAGYGNRCDAGAAPPL